MLKSERLLVRSDMFLIVFAASSVGYVGMGMGQSAQGLLTRLYQVMVFRRFVRSTVVVSKPSTANAEDHRVRSKIVPIRSHYVPVFGIGSQSLSLRLQLADFSAFASASASLVDNARTVCVNPTPIPKL